MWVLIYRSSRYSICMSRGLIMWWHYEAAPADVKGITATSASYGDGPVYSCHGALYNLSELPSVARESYLGCYYYASMVASSIALRRRRRQ